MSFFLTPPPVNDCRHEIKLVFPALSVEGLRARVLTHPYGLIETFPIRWVNNVYFDTYTYRSYADNLSGASQRAKVRYRWYNDLTDIPEYPESGQLEIKCKRNALGWKKIFPVTLTEKYLAATLQHNNWHDWIQAIKATLPPEGKLWLDHYPQPVMINRYLREYYASLDGLIRVTLDYQLQVYDQTRSTEINIDQAENLAEVVIVEVKFSPDHFEQAHQVIASFPNPISRFSKYVSGVTAARNLA